MFLDGLNAAIVGRLGGGLVGGTDGVTRPEPIGMTGAGWSFDWSAVGGAQLLPGVDGTRVTGGEGVQVLPGLDGTRVTGEQAATAPAVPGPALRPGSDAVLWPTPLDGVGAVEEPVYLLPAFDDGTLYEPPFNPAFSYHASGDYVFGMLSHA